MDFTLSEEQRDLRDLAAQIFEGRSGPERVREVEASADRFDRELWKELARANLLGLSLPEAVGGTGYGIIELCLLLEQQGRRVAPVPLLWTLASAATAIAEHGTPQMQQRWLPPVVSGEAVLTAALSEPGAPDLGSPRVLARREGGGWRLEGTKISVPAAHLASRVLVPASSESGVGVFLVNPAGPGVTLERSETTDREIYSTLVMSGAPVAKEDSLCDGGGGGLLLSSMRDRTMVGLCALQVGVAEEALRMASEYTSERQQFGRPLATNQGVALRAADAYIDVEAMRATMFQAAWRLSTGRDATREVMVAKWWASEGGQRVVHSTQHLHGGLGADIDYPVHRYFLWGKQNEVILGGASYELARLGREIAGSAR